MDKDNKSTQVDNIDKKLHISDVMNSLINELNRRRSYFNMTMMFNHGTQEGSVYQQAKTRVSEIDILLNMVKKNCS
jgi:hypothetical protein